MERNERKFLITIPSKHQKIIDEEVIKDATTITEEGPVISEIWREKLQDYREAEYRMLAWVDKSFSINRALYPGAGYDFIPTLVFGNRIINASLAYYFSEDQEYTQYLDHSLITNKILSNNASLPFADNTFDLMVALDLGFEVVGKYKEEILRVLNTKGLLVFAINNIARDNDVIDYYRKARLHQLEFPNELDSKGSSRTSFTIFKKVS